MSDRIAISGITGFGRHGVHAHETAFGQEFIVDVVIATDLGPAAATDDLELTIDYGHVAQLAHAHVVGAPHRLIETLAEAIAAEVVALPGVESVTVTVHKPHAPMPVGVADVLVTRHRSAPARVVLGLGSNLGDRLAALQAAVDALGDAGVKLKAISPIVRSAPVGGPPDQGDFLNAVLVGRTTAAPYDLLRICRGIETAAERDRSVRWGPRPIDVDILDFGGRRLAEPDLVLPHPRAADRAFVLVPWSLVAPDDHLGGTGPTVAELAADVDAAGVEVAAGLSLLVRRR